MTVRKLLVLPVAILIAASTLGAFQAKPVDVTGKWAGSLTRSDGQPSEAHFNFTQKGTALTGTAGPAADRQIAIENGKVATVKGVTSLTFQATQPNGLVMKFDLKVVEDRLKGKSTIEFNGETREATIDVGRAK